jgi:hypothetical protein
VIICIRSKSHQELARSHLQKSVPFIKLVICLMYGVRKNPSDGKNSAVKKYHPCCGTLLNLRSILGELADSDFEGHGSIMHVPLG